MENSNQKKNKHDITDVEIIEDENNSHPIRTKINRIGKIVLIAGGVAILTYLVIRRFTKKKKKKGKKTDYKTELITYAIEESGIARSIRNYISAFLLSVAKNQLVKLLSWIVTQPSDKTEKNQAN